MLDIQPEPGGDIPITSAIEHAIAELVEPGGAPKTSVFQSQIVLIDRRVLWRESLALSLRKVCNAELVTLADIDEWLTSPSGQGGDAQKPIVLLPSSTWVHAAFEKTDTLLDERRAWRFAILSDRDDDMSDIALWLRRGASGYIPTNLPFKVFVEALRFIEAGGVFVPASAFIDRASATKQEKPVLTEVLSGLTHRQLAVIDAVRRGKANKIIAYELNMCESTVKVHLRNIMRKLRATNRTELAYMANEAPFNSLFNAVRVQDRKAKARFYLPAADN